MSEACEFRCAVCRKPATAYLWRDEQRAVGRFVCGAHDTDEPGYHRQLLFADYATRSSRPT